MKKTSLFILVGLAVISCGADHYSPYYAATTYRNSMGNQAQTIGKINAFTYTFAFPAVSVNANDQTYYSVNVRKNESDVSADIICKNSAGQVKKTAVIDDEKLLADVNLLLNGQVTIVQKSSAPDPRAIPAAFSYASPNVRSRSLVISFNNPTAFVGNKETALFDGIAQLAQITCGK